MILYAKSPTQVEAEASHTDFSIWRVKRPCVGFFMLNSTLLRHADIATGLGSYSVVPKLYTCWTFMESAKSCNFSCEKFDGI
jgi:hypothetical protein